MGYSRDVIKGVSWGTFLDLSAKGSAVVKMAILARIFSPGQIGTFGIGLLVLGLLELITETGINVFLVQEEDKVDYYLDTAWVVSIVRGVLISIILLLAAYPVSLFFKDSNAFQLILAISLVPFLRGFINPAIVTLQKNLKFRQDAFYKFSISTIEDISTIIFSLITLSVFSLVFGMIVGVIIEVILTFIIVREKPRFSINRLHLGKIVGRGKWVTLAGVFDYFFEHTDDVAVGRLLNVSSLGIYQYSYNLSTLPLKSVAQQLGRVTFPVYVKLAEDKQRVKRAFVKTFWLTLAVVVPFGILLFFLSDPAVRIILGDKWLPAIPVLRVLALFGVVRALTNLFNPLFLAFKKQEYVTITTLVSIVVLGILIVPMTLSFGLVGAGASALIGSAFGLPTSFFLFNKVFKD